MSLPRAIADAANSNDNENEREQVLVREDLQGAAAPVAETVDAKRKRQMERAIKRSEREGQQHRIIKTETEHSEAIEQQARIIEWHRIRKQQEAQEAAAVQAAASAPITMPALSPETKALLGRELLILHTGEAPTHYDVSSRSVTCFGNLVFALMQMPPGYNQAAMKCKDYREAVTKTGELLWLNRPVNNVNILGTEPDNIDYFGLGLKFLDACCRASATAQAHYQIYGWIVAKVLKRAHRKLVDMIIQAESDKTNKSDADITAGFVNYESDSSPSLVTQTCTLWGQSAFSVSELTRLRSYAQGTTTQAPSSLKSLFDAGKFTEAMRLDIKSPVANRAKESFLHLLELLGRFDAIEQTVLASRNVADAAATPSVLTR